MTITMKISQLYIGADTTLRLETQTDALYLISSEAERARYMVAFGDVRTEYDAEYDVYRVAKVASQIEKYTEKKMIQIARWGSAE